jgi:hypothetical protein
MEKYFLQHMRAGEVENKFLCSCVCVWGSIFKDTKEIAKHLRRHCLYNKFVGTVIGWLFRLNLTGS